MVNKLKKYINFSILVSCLLMVLGGIIFIYPAMTLKLLSYIVAVILIIFGVYLVVQDVIYKKFWLLFDFTLMGIICLVLGIVLLMYPDILTTLIPIFLGIWFIVSGITKFRLTSLLGTDDGIFITSFIMSILSVICGVLFIISPLSGATIIISFIGILLFVYSLSDIVNMIIFKKNINKLEKSLKDGITVTIK